jgi:hypothetical protein
MADKQRLRNTLCTIEDDVRRLRKTIERDGFDRDDAVATLTLIARLTQVIREDVVQ